MRTINAFSILALGLLVISSGCGKKGTSGTGTVKTWTNAQYHITTSYPDNWNLRDAVQVDDPKSGDVTLALFCKPGNADPKEITEHPPYVKVQYLPKPKVSAPDLPAGIPNPEAESGQHEQQLKEAMNVPVMELDPTAGWDAQGAKDTQSRKIKIAGGVDANEGTATLEQGTLMHATYAQSLAGVTQKLRVIIIPAQEGAYQITAVAPPDSDGWTEANQIVDSLKFTK